MNISLSDHFTYKKLLRFTFPSIVMMILTSIYGVVDGVFVSNFVGSEAFASINIIMPFLMILGAIGFMTGSGGSALVALTFGTGNEKKAKEMLKILKHLDAEAEKNEEELVKKRRNERKQMIKQMEKIVSQYDSD